MNFLPADPVRPMEGILFLGEITLFGQRALPQGDLPTFLISRFQLKEHRFRQWQRQTASVACISRARLSLRTDCRGSHILQPKTVDVSPRMQTLT
jgi:hypothetical protein